MSIKKIFHSYFLLFIVVNFAHASLAIPFDSVQGTAPSSSSNFTFIGPTKWEPGPNSASVHSFGLPGPMSPGGATWSAMPSGVGISSLVPSDQSDHPAGTSTDIESLITAAMDGLEYRLFDAAFDVWAAAANITNLGQVTDGGLSAEAGGLEATGSQLGDIRVAGYQFGASPTQSGVLAHAYFPHTEAFGGPGGTIGGDIHFDTAELWSDDENDTTNDQDFDFFTVALHELGHSLGLGHSSVAGSVMEATYAGGRRTLGPDDIAGIQAIYGVPEPSAFLFGCLLVGVGAVANRKKIALMGANIKKEAGGTF